VSNEFQTLSRDENQARGLAQYALDFVAGRLGGPSPAVLAKVEQFHTDAIACAVSALGCRAHAPLVLRREAFDYRDDDGVPCFGSTVRVKPEKAVLACSSAVREWDANGTNFGYNPARGHARGEFGHNDFYPVAVAAAQQVGLDGAALARAMICLDEIRGRLAEVFALKDHRIDHVLHGAIASAAVYGAVLGASVDQIESALGLVVAHYVPFRAIRAGKQLSDSKGASAAISAEMAVQSVHRAMRGFVGPADIFRNPQAVFCLFEPPDRPGRSPFDLTLATAGDDFAVMGMHFKLGIYEHQSAGAIAALIDLLRKQPELLDEPARLERVEVAIYEPAYGIICDPAKRDPRTRQSADHSLYYILATLLRKAYTRQAAGWRELMLVPRDYDTASLHDATTREIMTKIDVRHGGRGYDEKYPDGIPTSVVLHHRRLGAIDSGLVMYPQGHARNESGDLDDLLAHKFGVFAAMGVDDPDALAERLSGLSEKTSDQVAGLYDFSIRGFDA
jgi:2-methylcitrate dehydratase